MTEDNRLKMIDNKVKYLLNLDVFADDQTDFA